MTTHAGFTAWGNISRCGRNKDHVKGTEIMVDEIRQVYQMLEDEQSKEIYLARLNYLVTGNFRPLEMMIEKYMPQLIVPYNMAVSDLIHSLPKDRKVLLYGAGADGRLHLHHFKNDKRFIGFCDRDIEKQKVGLNGYTVISPEQLLQMKDVSVVISTRKGAQEIKNFLKQSDFPEDRIYEMPVWVRKIDAGQYFNPDFMSFEKEEVFVDAGCCNLRTSIRLKKYCSRLKKVYAFEPDPGNFEKCISQKSELADTVIELFPCGTWSESKTLHFSATANGKAHICEDGEVSVEVMPIDEAVAGKDRITFIKMDVEGSELESLKGAKNTILKDKPKLAICIYHKPEDLVEIPMYIRELVPEYKLYVRHHSSNNWETVLYAVMP